MTPDGHVDLRGLVVRTFVRGAVIHRMDLTGMILDGFGQFGGCQVEESRFSHASLQTNVGANFSSCDFFSANLAGAVLRGKFTDCRFVGAKLSSATATEVQFVRCDFSRANIRKAMLTHCQFDECLFQDSQLSSCSFAFSVFKNTPLDDALLETTIMERVVRS